MKYKVSWRILFLVFILVIIGGLLVSKNKSIDQRIKIALLSTSDWKTYNNDYWSFKYPNDWEAVNCGDTYWVMLGPSPKDGQEVACQSEYPHPNPEIYIARQSKKQLPEIPYTHSDVIKTIREDVHIGGQVGVRQTLLFPNGDQTKDAIYVEHLDSIDTFHFFGDDQQIIFSKILSTFKFVK